MLYIHKSNIKAFGIKSGLVFFVSALERSHTGSPARALLKAPTPLPSPLPPPPPPLPPQLYPPRHSPQRNRNSLLSTHLERLPTPLYTLLSCVRKIYFLALSVLQTLLINVMFEGLIPFRHVFPVSLLFSLAVSYPVRFSLARRYIAYKCH